MRLLLILVTLTALTFVSPARIASADDPHFMLLWPVPPESPISQEFGANPEDYFGQGHEGIDFDVRHGTPVIAVAGGHARWEEGEATYGCHVVVTHPWGSTTYAHLSRRGNIGNVRQGELIGYSGGATDDPCRGRSTGDHLHFGLQVNGISDPDRFWGYIDPLPFLIYSNLENEVILFEHSFYRGSAVKVQGPGSVNLSGSFAFLSDKPSSIAIPRGWSVIVYKHENKAGQPSERKMIRWNDVDFANDTFDDGTSLNDNISAIEVLPYLADNFDDPVSGVLPTSSDRPSAYVRGYVAGEYQVQIVDPAFDPVAAAFIPGIYTNASIAVDARLVGASTSRRLSVSCRRQPDADSAYRLTVSPDTGRFLLSRRDTGTRVDLVSWQSSPAIRRGNQTNRLELICVGTTISAKINGIELASVQDGTYQLGRMWIGVAATNATADARFNDLVVTRG